MRNKTIYTLLLLLLYTATYAQNYKGQLGFGGEFSFINSRNSVSRTANNFAENYTNGFNVTLIGGKFVTPKSYVFAVLGANYSSRKSYNITDDFSNKVEQKTSSTNFLMEAGLGIRRYFIVNEKNVVGFFVQGQVVVGNTWIVQKNYAARNDSVYNDVKQSYPIRLLSLNVNPGVYVNISRQWQLTVNIGNLYFTQTFVPENVDLNISKRNASFGLDVNLFDFRLGVLYTPRRKE